MRVQDEEARICRKLEDWPEHDRVAFLRGLANDDPFALTSSPAARWRPATVHKNRRGYGRFLTFLVGKGTDLSGAPADRITPESLRSYIGELKAQRVSPNTLLNRILELYAVARLIAPDVDWRWMRRVATNLDQAAFHDARCEEPKVLASTILRHARNELDRLAKARVCRTVAWGYRNWLIVLILAILPIRRRNISGLRLSHVSQQNGIWQIDLPANETKTNRPFAGPLPQTFGRYLEYYLSDIRPVFANVSTSDAFWLTSKGKPLSEQTIYLMVRRVTYEAFGHALNLHQFRHIFATTITIEAPQLIETARAGLGHADPDTTRRYYDRASSIHASRIHAKTISKLRRG